MRTEHFIEELECEITRDECRERGKELGRQHQLRREHDVKAGKIKADLKAEEKTIVAEIDRLAKIVHIGKERRPIDCHEVADHRRFQIDTVRLDNGKTIRSRPMDTTERKQSQQGDLFAFQADVQRAAAEGAKAAADDDSTEAEDDLADAGLEDAPDADDDDDPPESGRPVYAEPDSPQRDTNTVGSEAAPNPMPGAVDLAPTAEDEANWASNKDM